VRPKSGDPSIFGRAAEEVAAAKAAGIAFEIVPGITAALAMAASCNTPLTCRHVSDTLVFAAGHLRDGAAASDVARHCSPGRTTVFYMAIGHAERVQADLLTQIPDPSLPVRVSVDVSKPTERHVHTTVEALVDDLTAHAVTGCALISVTWPKGMTKRACAHQAAMRSAV